MPAIYGELCLRSNREKTVWGWYQLVMSVTESRSTDTKPNTNKNHVKIPKRNQLNPAAAGPPRHALAVGGGICIVALLYICVDNFTRRYNREAKLFTRAPEHQASIISKFGVDHI